jgi:GntR family transcriptional regulator
MSSLFFLSAGDPRPMYQQLIDQVATKIAAGDWPPGYGLPSIRELAGATRVSVITVKRAYLELERMGVIVTRHGKGSFVADREESPAALARAELDRHLEALLACARRLGLSRDDVLRRVDAAALHLPQHPDHRIPT